MKGWKTWAGGLGQIFTGVGIIAYAISSGDIDKIMGGFTLISTGITTIGIGHKIEKAGL